MTIDPFTARVLIVVAAALVVLVARHWLATVRAERASYQHYQPDPEPDVDAPRLDDHTTIADLHVELDHAEQRIAEWAAYADDLKAKLDHLAASRRAERRRADSLAAWLGAEQWHSAELAAELALLRREVVVARWARQQTVAMRLAAERQVGWTELEPMPPPVLDVHEVELAEVIPITTEHATVDENGETRRERLDRLRDDESVPIPFWPREPSHPTRRELPPAPATRLSRLPAERVA